MSADILPGANGQKPSLSDIETVYKDLMRCYSACLSNLVLRSWPITDEFIPTIVRWRAKKRIDMVRTTFLLLIASLKDENSKKILVKYCEDMESFSSQIARSGYMTILYGSIPAFLLILPMAFSKELGAIISGDKISGHLKLIIDNLPDLHLLYLALLVVLILIFLSSIIRGFKYSSKLFHELGVSQKDKEFYNLIYAFSSI